MINRARVWTVGVVLGCMSSVAVNPVFAQTQPAPAAGAPPPAAAAPPPAGHAYPPPPPPAGYPPPAQEQPGYPPPPAGQPGYPPPAQGQYAPAPYPAPYGTPYATYQPPPAGPPQMVHRARKGLLIAGLITFGVSWGLTVLVSASLNDSSTTCVTAKCQDAADLFWIPFAGPILADNADPGDGSGRSLAILWSLAEVAGATMTIIGMIGHDVPEYGYGRRRASTWQLLPTLTASSRGLALHATF